MNHILSIPVRVAVCSLLIFQLTGCGTLMYPERKGQRAGKIDAGVAVLDGIGLLLFIVPGVIAFAIDFNNGTIYLPGTSRSSLELKDVRQVKFDSRHTTMASIEKAIKENTGYSIALDQPNLRIMEIKSINDLSDQLAGLNSANQSQQIALSN